MKLPCIHLYPGDWLRDDVSGCSLAAQGLWLRMMFIMHDADRYGYLSKNGVALPPSHIASRCGLPVEQYTILLAELDNVTVPRRTSDGIIFSKRMVEDAKARALKVKAGSKGGKQRASNEASRDPSKPQALCDIEDEYEAELEKKPMFEDVTELQAQQLYELYPVKKGRKPALAKIRLALKKTSFEVLKAAVESYIEECTARGTIFAHPTTWFNQERWTDEPDLLSPVPGQPRSPIDRDDEPLPQQKGWEDLTPEQDRELFGGAA